MHTSVLGAALSQIEAGTTTLVDFAHYCRSAEHADANVEGLVAGGIRAVFLHGPPHSSPRRRVTDKVVGTMLERRAED